MSSKISQKKYSTKGGKQVVTAIKDFKPENIIFDDIVEGEGGGNKYQRIPIFYQNDQGERCQLIFQTEELYSHGVSENEKSERGELQFPLCLWSLDGATEEEEAWTDAFCTGVRDRCVEHIAENCDKIGRPGEEEDLPRELCKYKGGILPIYWKIETVKDPKTGKSKLAVMEGTGPTLYPKLIEKVPKKSSPEEISNENQLTRKEKMDKKEFITMFCDQEKSDENNEDVVNPLDILGKPLRATVALKIESIFVNAKNIKLQVKVLQVNFKLKKTTRTRLMAKPVVEISEDDDFDDSVKELDDKMDTKLNIEDSDDDAGSLDFDSNDINIDDDIKQIVEKPAPPKKSIPKNISRKKNLK